MTAAERYYPFKSATDFNFAKKFWRCNITIEETNIFLKNSSDDKDDGLLHDILSFDSAQSWRNQILRIPYRIANDAWLRVPFTVDSIVTDNKKKYILV